MKIADAIKRIKIATHDAVDEYSEAHCLDFLNYAIQQAASMLIAGGYMPLTKEVILKDGSYLPHNFMKQCGKYPICVTSNRIKLLEGNEIRFRYFATPERITEMDLDLPFPNEALNEAIVQLAIVLALNENEFDTQQDTALMSAFQQAVAGALGNGG